MGPRYEAEYKQSTFQAVKVLEVMVDPDDEELTAQDQAEIDRSREWLKQNKPVPHDEVLAKYGLTMADFLLKTNGT